MARSRRWCFTIHYESGNCPCATVKLWSQRYLVFGHEVCPQTSRLHLQGYVEFVGLKSLAQMKRLSPVAHWEVAKGNSAQNKDYCSKGSSVFEAGSRTLTSKEKGEKEKERWENVWKLAKLGKIEDIDADIRVRSYSTLKLIAKDFMQRAPAAEDVCGDWFHGAPGTGKSRYAREVANGDWYDKPCNKWWDGYQGQDTVLIDDLDKNHRCLGHHLKIWADRYAFTAEVKNGALSLRPKRIIVTSNYSIDEIFGEDEQLVLALARRFKCKLFTYLFVFVVYLQKAQYHWVRCTDRVS